PHLDACHAVSPSRSYARHCRGAFYRSRLLGGTQKSSLPCSCSSFIHHFSSENLCRFEKRPGFSPTCHRRCGRKNGSFIANMRAVAKRSYSTWHATSSALPSPTAA